MTLSPIGCQAGTLSLTAAVLIVLSQVIRLAVGRLLGPDGATTPAYTLTYALALLGMATLLLAVTAIYTCESAALGRSASSATSRRSSAPCWSPATGGSRRSRFRGSRPRRTRFLACHRRGPYSSVSIATVGLYTVGWTLFGLAALRARAFPRAAALLLLVGGLAGPLALSTPYQIPLAIAIGWIGYTLDRESAPSAP